MDQGSQDYAYANNQQMAYAAPEQAPKSNGTKIAIIIGCLVIALVVAAVVAVFAVRVMCAHEPVSVSFVFEAANYNADSGSGIPVHIEGTDVDGNVVSETALVDQGNAGVELLRGSYDISVVGSPVNGGGGIYAVPGTVIHVEIGDNEAVIDGNTQPIGEGDARKIELPTITFAEIDGSLITDEQISAIREWMKSLDFGDGHIAKFADLIAAYKKAGAEKAKAAEQAAWVTKISGSFWGEGAWLGSPSVKLKCYLDGDKLTVKGELNRRLGSGSSQSLGYGEWHFLITDSTKYVYFLDEDKYVSKSEFIEMFPESFVTLHITVRDGYVTQLGESA